MPVLAGGTGERLYSDTDRHHYTFSCFHSPSMKCHFLFGVLSLCLGCALFFLLHVSFSHFAQSLSFTLFFHIFVLNSHALSFSPLTASSSCPLFKISVSNPYFFASLDFTPNYIREEVLFHTHYLNVLLT